MYALLIQDAAGEAGLTFTATNADSSAWGTTGITLLPMSAAPTGIKYDGMGINSSMTGYASISFSHVATAGACVILDIVVDRDVTLTNVQYGGQNMTLQGSARFTGYSGNAGIWRYSYLNAPGGLSTVTATLSANSYFSAQTTAYTGVGAVTEVSTTYGNNSVPSQAVTTTSGKLIVQAIGVYSHTLGTLSGGTNLNAFSCSSISLAINEATASDTFTAGLTGVNWGAISNVLASVTASVDAALAITVTEPGDAVRNAIVNAAQALTSSPTTDAIRNQFATSSLATTATITDAGNFAPAWTDVSQVITTTLSSTGTRAGSFDAPLAITASLPSGDKTNQIIAAAQAITANTSATSTRAVFANASLSVTATITDAATRNANVDSASQTITTTLSDAINWDAHADSSVSSTVTLSGTATRNAVVNAAPVITATATSAFWQGQRLDTSTAITVTFTANETESATGATPLAVIASMTAEATKTKFVDAPQVITVTASGDMIKNQLLDASLTAWGTGTFPYTFPILLNAPTADMFMIKGIFLTSVWTVSLDGTVVRNVGVGALISVTTAVAAGVQWYSRAQTFTLAITATPTAAVTRSQSIDAALVINATGIVIYSANHPLDSALAATAVVSSTANVDFLIDVQRAVIASQTAVGSRRQSLDAPLEITATSTSKVKWAAKFQAALALTAIQDPTGTRNAIVNAPLVVTATRDQYLYQTEQFDVILVTTAGFFVLFAINIYGDTDLAITATSTADMLRTLYSDAALDITTDFPVEAVRNQYIDTNLEVQDSADGAVNWDALAEAPLPITVGLPSLLNQGILVNVSLDVAADAPVEVLLGALLDALLLTESLALTADSTRDQYIDALQEIVFTSVEEAQGSIKMEVVLVVPISTFGDTGSGQAHSNFFVFYI